MNCLKCKEKYFYYHTLERQVYCCFNYGIEIKEFVPCFDYIDSIDIKNYNFYFEIEPNYSDIIIYDNRYDFNKRPIIGVISNISKFGIESTKIKQENVDNIINILNKYVENLMFI